MAAVEELALGGDEGRCSPSRSHPRASATPSARSGLEDRLARAEKMFKQRCTQVAFGEAKLAAVETRLIEIKQLADELEKSIQTIASREQLINAVKARSAGPPDLRPQQGRPGARRREPQQSPRSRAASTSSCPASAKLTSGSSPSTHGARC
jgi:hypothetical protein